MKWYSVTSGEEQERLLDAWPDAPLGNLELLGGWLTTAREDVIACAPAPPAQGELGIDEDGYLGYQSDDYPPDRYVLAQLAVVKKYWNASRVTTGGGDIGSEEYSWTPFQRDRLIRDMIRPRDTKPHVL